MCSTDFPHYLQWLFSAVLLGLTATRLHYTLFLPPYDPLNNGQSFFDPIVVELAVTSILALFWSSFMCVIRSSSYEWHSPSCAQHPHYPPELRLRQVLELCRRAPWAHGALHAIPGRRGDLLGTSTPMPLQLLRLPVLRLRHPRPPRKLARTKNPCSEASQYPLLERPLVNVRVSYKGSPNLPLRLSAITPANLFSFL